QINSGLLGPGDLVDSERKLAERYEVSLMTARHALSELATRQLVVRKPSGTVVASPQIQPNRLASYSEQMREGSVTVRSRVIGFMKVHNEAVGAQLCLPPGERITQIERLRLGDLLPAGQNSLKMESFRTRTGIRLLLAPANAEKKLFSCRRRS